MTLTGTPAASGASGGGGVPALVKEKERGLTGGCERPRPGYRWRFPDGSDAPVRCRATNKCSYCAMVAAFENALVVRLDALDGEAFPRWGLTTTTARPGFAAAELKQAERKLFQFIRRRASRELTRRPEYLGFVEFTRGRSDGVRRPHVHHLLKFAPDELMRALTAPCGSSSCLVCRRDDGALCPSSELSRRWRDYTGDAWVVECRPLRTPIGAIAYLALHHHKREQQPPEGWHGKRFRPSRGYFNRPVPMLRAEARELLADKRIERQLVDAFDPPHGFDVTVLDELILENLDAARERARENRPELVRVEALMQRIRGTAAERPERQPGAPAAAAHTPR